MPEYLKVTVTAESASGETHTWTIPRCANFGVDTTYVPEDISSMSTRVSARCVKALSFSMEPLLDDSGRLYQVETSNPQDDPEAAYEQAVKDAAESARDHALRVDAALLRLTEARRAAGGQS